jgi:aminopeptidase YwaD
MTIFRPSFFLSCALLLVFNINSYGQIWKKVMPAKNNNGVDKEADEIVERQLRADVSYLAADNMEGRLPGTNGEMLSGLYIQKRMSLIGLLPYDKSYVRSFKFERGTELSPDIRFSINGRFVSVPEEAFPADFSVGGVDENYVLPESKEANSPWVISMYETIVQANDAHFNWEEACYKRAKAAVERGASSVLFYDKYGSKNFPSYKNQVFKGDKLNVPVLFLSKKCYDASIANMNVMQPMAINIVYKKIMKSATNVLGYLNNNAGQTVIIAAHYDHLGFGLDFVDNKGSHIKEVYNGANDNASGVAAMLSIAEKIKQSQDKKYNYLFIAFSAEEFGEMGSKAFIKASDFIKGDIAYMINLNMVGRMDLNKQLWVNGTYSSLSWNTILGKIPGSLKLIKDSDAVQASDEISFYNVGVPMLSFSSGPDPDHHLPSDDVIKLNFVGAKDVVNYVFNLTDAINKEPAALLFTTYHPPVKVVQPSVVASNQAAHPPQLPSGNQTNHQPAPATAQVVVPSNNQVNAPINNPPKVQQASTQPSSQPVVATNNPLNNQGSNIVNNQPKVPASTSVGNKPTASTGVQPSALKGVPPDIQPKPVMPSNAPANIQSNMGGALSPKPTDTLSTHKLAAKPVNKDTIPASLGILPDEKYSANDGVRIDGTEAGKPAQKGGILHGDIIFQIANYPISNIQSYKGAIANFHKGDQVRIKLRRNRSLLDLTINL